MEKKALRAELVELAKKLNNVTYDELKHFYEGNQSTEQAKECNLLIVYPMSDDLLYLSGYYDDEYGAWEGTTLFCTRKDAYGKPPSGGYLFTVSSIWHDNREAPWEVMTDASDYLSFDIVDEGEKWGNGLIIDMTPYLI